MPAADIVIAADDDLIVVGVIGRVVDVAAARGVRQRNKDVHEFLPGGIEARRRNDVVRERYLREGIGGLLPGLGKVAAALEIGRHNQVGHGVGTAVAQAFVGDEEERAVAALVKMRQQNGAAQTAAKLVAPQLGDDQRKEIARVKSIVAHKLVERAVELIGSGL